MPRSQEQSLEDTTEMYVSRGIHTLKCASIHQIATMLEFMFAVIIAVLRSCGSRRFSQPSQSGNFKAKCRFSISKYKSCDRKDLVPNT